MRKSFILFIFISFLLNKANGQLFYSDSCLTLGFYYKTRNTRLETSKTLTLKNVTQMLAKSWTDNKIFNLVTQFRNNCNKSITVPNKLRLQTDFWIECIKLNIGTPDTILFSITVDYVKGSEGAKITKLKAKKLLQIP